MIRGTVNYTNEFSEIVTSIEMPSLQHAISANTVHWIHYELKYKHLNAAACSYYHTSIKIHIRRVITEGRDTRKNIFYTIRVTLPINLRF